MNRPKPIYIQLTVMQDKEKQKILTSENLDPSNVCHFCLKNGQSAINQYSREFPMIAALDLFQMLDLKISKLQVPC